jgi:hypothetical protein
MQALARRHHKLLPGLDTAFCAPHIFSALRPEGGAKRKTRVDRSPTVGGGGPENVQNNFVAEGTEGRPQKVQRQASLGSPPIRVLSVAARR